VISIKLSLYLRMRELFPGIEILRKFSFNTFVIRDYCALLAAVILRLSMGFADFGAKSAHFYIYNDCFVCLSPRYLTA